MKAFDIRYVVADKVRVSGFRLGRSGSDLREFDDFDNFAFLGFGGIPGPKPYKFMGFGGLPGQKPYKFTGFGGLRFRIKVLAN